MDKVLLLGDYFNGLAELSRLISEKYEVHQIAFFNTFEYPKLEIAPDWLIIDCRDFHELTIKLMDFEPERVIYLSPFNRITRCERDPELAEMTNSEFLEHLREILSIFGGHLILLVPNINTKISQNTILQKTINQGLDIIKGMGRLTIIEYNQILDSSPEGYQAWLGTLENGIEEKNNQLVVTIEELFSELTDVISNSVFGKLKSNHVSLNQVVISDQLFFTGNPKDFI